MISQLDIAAHVSRCDPQRLSPAERVFLKTLLLDYLGCTIAGARSDAAARLRGAMMNRETGPAHVVGARTRAPAPVAAFLNAYACHVMDFDDVHGKAIYHPGAPTISAIRAVAERDEIDTARFVAGVVAGYEAGIRLGEAAGKEHYRRHHTTGTVGCVGAAAGAALALGLDPAGVSSAMGFAATQAAALWAYRDDGSDAKPVHAGHAAMVGVLSADLARAGLQGPRFSLEGPNGFLRTLGGDVGSSTETAQGPWRFTSTSLKPYACCGHTHSGLAAAARVLAELGEEGLRSGPLPTIRIETYAAAIEIAGIQSPETIEHARFSYSYLVSHFLVHGGLENAFAQAGLSDPRVAALARRIEIVRNEQMDLLYPDKQPVRLTLMTDDGREWCFEVMHSLGSPENPMPEALHRSKLEGLAGCDIGSLHDQVADLVGHDF